MHTLMDIYTTPDGRKITPIIESWASAVRKNIGGGEFDFVWSDKANHICLHRQKAHDVKLIIEDKDGQNQIVHLPAGLVEKIAQKFNELQKIETNDFID